MANPWARVMPLIVPKETIDRHRRVDMTITQDARVDVSRATRELAPESQPVVDPDQIPAPAGLAYDTLKDLLTELTTLSDTLKALGFITKGSEATLTNEFALGSLADGLLYNHTTTGIPTIAVAGTDYAVPGAALTETAETSGTNVAGNTNAAPGNTTRQYGFYTLPTTAKLWKITGIEWRNGTTVAGNVWSGVERVNASPPTQSGTTYLAVGRPAAMSGSGAVQRVSVVSSELIRGGTVIGAWFASTSATATFGKTTVTNNNNQKAIPAGAPALADFTAWTATTDEYYIKIYLVGYS